MWDNDKYDIPVQFKSSNTLRQKLVHTKDKTKTMPYSAWRDALYCQET